MPLTDSTRELAPWNLQTMRNLSRNILKQIKTLSDSARELLPWNVQTMRNLIKAMQLRTPPKSWLLEKVQTTINSVRPTRLWNRKHGETGV